MKRILRYEIPIDDQWHQIDVNTFLNGDYPVASRQAEHVDVWLAKVEGKPTTPSWWRVVGTGQPVPEGEDIRWAGTAVTPSGVLVWHVIYTLVDPTGAPE